MPVSVNYRASKMDRRVNNIRTMKADRVKIVWMWLGGMSARKISCETGASICTVYRWIRRWQDEGNVDTRPYRGRSRAFLKLDAPLVTPEPREPLVPTYNLGHIPGSLPLFCYFRTMDRQFLRLGEEERHCVQRHNTDLVFKI